MNKNKGKKGNQNKLDKSDVSELANEKSVLEKQLKQKDREIKKYENLLKKAEKSNLNQSKNYEQKVQKYSE